MPNLSDSDRHAIGLRIRDLRRTGKPFEAEALEGALRNDENPPASLMGKGKFKPEKSINVPLADLVIPPRSGRGSGKNAWAELALTVMDVEPQVIEALSRDEVIDLLEARGIIGPEDEDE